MAKREEPRSVGPRLGSLPPPADALQSFGSLVNPEAEGLEVAAVVAVVADNDLKAINAYQAFPLGTAKIHIISRWTLFLFLFTVGHYSHDAKEGGHNAKCQEVGS